MSANLNLTVNALLQRQVTLGDGTVVYNPQTIFTQELTDGTGSGEVEEGSTVSASIVAAAPKEWDLFGSSAGDYNVAGIDTDAIVFTKIKSIVVVNLNTTAAEILILGGSAANAWDAMFSSVAASKIQVPPGGVFVASHPASGWTVDNTHKLLKIDAASGTIAFTMQITGLV